MTGAGGVAGSPPVERCEGYFRGDCAAVIALLAADRDVLITELAKFAERKLAVPAFRLLQAQDIRGVSGEKLGHEVDPQTYRIDIPCRQRKPHDRALGRGACGPQGRSDAKRETKSQDQRS